MKFLLVAVLLCASLTPSIDSNAATKASKAPAAAQEPQPELLNGPPLSGEPKKDESKAATPAAAEPSPAAAAPAPVTAPAPAAPTPPVAAASPPPDTAQTPPVAAKPAVMAEQSNRLLNPSLTDAVISLLALVIAVFAWRIAATTSRLAATTQTQLDANRRAIEASERAAEAAKRSADAAEKSATVMQDTAARQLRPYVTVKEFLQGPVKDEKNFLHGWVFQVVWQNTGATPTRGFRYWAALRQFDHEIPGDFDFAAPMTADFAGGELGSNGTVTSGTLFVAQQDVLQIQAGARKAVLYGRAEYNDAGGQDLKRDTRFCVEVVLVSDPGGAHGTPFSFSYFARHNALT